MHANWVKVSINLFYNLDELYTTIKSKTINFIKGEYQQEH